MRMTAWTCLKRGFDVFAAHLPVIMMAWIIILAIQQVIDLLIPDSWVLLEWVVTLLVLAPLYAGQQLIALRAVREEPVSVRDLFAGVPQWGAITGAYFLNILAVVLGTLLFIIPGIIFAVMFAFAPVRFLDPGLGERHIRSITALRESREITEGSRGTLFGISLILIVPIAAFVLVSVVAALHPGFPSWLLELVAILCGTLFLGPVSTTSYMVVYDQLTRRVAPELEEEPTADASDVENYEPTSDEPDEA